MIECCAGELRVRTSPASVNGGGGPCRTAEVDATRRSLGRVPRSAGGAKEPEPTAQAVGSGIVQEEPRRGETTASDATVSPLRGSSESNAPSHGLRRGLRFFRASGALGIAGVAVPIPSGTGAVLGVAIVDSGSVLDDYGHAVATACSRVSRLLLFAGHEPNSTREVINVTTPTDPIEDLQARVTFLEEVLYNLGALLTGKADASALPQLSSFPVNSYDQGRILTAIAEVLVGDKAPTCPPLCRFPPTGGTVVRPSNWPKP